MTTAAVFNEFWSTGGGGETFCGGIAQALAADGFDVTLLGCEPFDPVRLGERLSLDLSGCEVRIVDRRHDRVGEASADYDLFVNGSYLSTAPNLADAGIYVVHFPGSRPPSSWARHLRWLAPGEGPDQPVSFRWGQGFHAADAGAGGAAWTTGTASLDVTLADSRPVTLQLVFAHLRPPMVGPGRLRVEIDGHEAVTAEIPASSSGLGDRIRGRFGTAVPVRIEGPGTHTVTLRSETFVPADLGIGDDRRPLGVPLKGITSGSRRARAIATLLPGVYHEFALPSVSNALSGYDVVASNSAFTKGFVEDWWSIEESPVLYPPVSLRPRSPDKTTRIVAVGRFFDSASGHSKKQLELVQGFRRLRALGVDGWTLTFVGGCDASGRGYLDRVRAEAEGLPVEFLVDATGAERDEALATASIFWHATGLGEDAERHPDRMEHFGISTVEAMSTGAVPVVYAGGGQLEVVQDGASGHHFRDLDELVALTRRLIDDPAELERLADGASRRAADFGDDRFRDRLRTLVARAFDADPDGGAA